MRIIKKIGTALLIAGVVALALWLLVLSISNNGLWTLLYIIEAGLLVMFIYVYLPVLITLLSFPWLKRMAQSDPSRNQPSTYFALLIPAHNEARLIPALVKSVQAQNYPQGMFQAFVVADNCSDNTAELARQGGATCLERHTDRPSNKGQALAYAWEQLKTRREVPQDAVILLVDADCQLEPDFLAEMNRMVSQPGSAQVVQSFRYVSNSRSSSTSTLDAAAEALRQWVQLGSRKILGLGSQICGSGVSFRRPVFAHLMEGQQHTLVEDKAWEAQLLDEGIHIDWCPSARLGYEAVENNADFQKQRKRWVGGQIALIKAFAPKMTWQGITRLDLSQLDFALSVIQLPRSFMLMLAGLFGLIAFVIPAASFLPWWAWWGLGALFLVYAAYGFLLIRAEGKHYVRLFLAPMLVFGVAFTTLSSLLGRGVRRWDATRGTPPPDTQAAQPSENLETITKK